MLQTKKLSPLAVIVGVGPGLGSAIAKKFAMQQFNVALVARNQLTLESLAKEINQNEQKAFAFSADVTNAENMVTVFNKIIEALGPPHVLIYNAASPFNLEGICDIDPEKFIHHWKINCLGGLLAAQQVLPHMVKRKNGVIIFTGATAALRGSAKMADFAVGKFSQRALAQSMAREFGPQGIHIAHVIIDGQIATPSVLTYFQNRPLETFLNPEAIANVYWHLYEQDQTTWTHEIDLRPSLEKF